MRGWGKPIIQRLPTGDLVASLFKSLRHEPNPNYPDAHEEAALSVSHDEGLTWSEPRLLGLPVRPTQFSVLSDGTIIMGGWPHGLYRSEDGGQTFGECVVRWDEFSRDRRPGVVKCYGETIGVQEMPDGSLVTTCETYIEPWERYDDAHAYVIRSTDRGVTWGDASFIINTDETSVLPLPDGRMLGFVRLSTQYSRDVLGQGGHVGEGGDQMAIMESGDRGYTWTEPKLLGLGMAQIPAFPLLLPDGRLLLIYGNRQFPFGAQVVASRDLGKTWDLENFLMLAWAAWHIPGGHPRSILMPDESIITGYYARYFMDHPEDVNLDLVAHCLRWRVPNDWPPV